ncbi:MAG TPA: rod shape-determining protein RodA [Bacteroidales bacterium]|nr:rod shape-determining protein RodA [Bacteroidales bacterium]HOU96240.1 rod shape-determining protein RodA [Bacteroidales bacterium]HQG36833.1 rod shape-determining protein RodA [Bacteroidales bacterium]HQG53055.1 rod shape-determining protein RodA [Bacteroidales bacterium]
MERKIKIWAAVDKVTILLFLLLVLIGWLNIYSAVYNEEQRKIFDFSQRYGKQMVWIITTFLLAFAVLNIDSRFYFFFGYLIYGIFILFLFLVLLFGNEINGTRAWFEIGPFNIQPSEFAKAGTALALAKYLNTRGQELTRLQLLIPAAAIILLPALLTAAQPDMGTTAVYFGFFIVLFREGLSPYLFFTAFLVIILSFVALIFNDLYITILIISLGFLVAALFIRKFSTLIKSLMVFAVFTGTLYLLNYYLVKSFSLLFIIISGLLLSGIFYGWHFYRYKAKELMVIYLFTIGSILYVNMVDYGYHNFLKPHQQQRIDIFLRLKSDPKGAGYNINQSVISIGSGGLTGKGFLRGTQTKYKFVPAQSTDFIFCTIGEEWGFLGSLVVISLYVFLMLRLIFLAERQKSSFSRIYGYGVVSILLIHFFVNIGMTTGIMPVIGIPLPFLSYGGSSLWGFTLLLFIFLRLDAARNEYLI